MAICPKCEKEIADAASICKHCNAILKTPKRPKGLLFLAIILFLIASYSVVAFFASFYLHSGHHIGILPMPKMIVLSFYFISAGLSTYCGIGFLKQKVLSRKIYLYWSGIELTRVGCEVVYSVFSEMNMDDVHFRMMRLMEDNILRLFLFAILYIIIIIYLRKTKDYFTN